MPRDGPRGEVMLVMPSAAGCIFFCMPKQRAVNFYNDEDRESVASTQTRKGSPPLDVFGGKVKEGRKPWNTERPAFAVDRDRVLHSPAFRRLQGKTQVFLSGEYDFYRNRLTHSIEVAQIGRAIAYHLSHQPKSPIRHTTGISGELVEACCLAHDIGNPPFGHAGEETLNEIMLEHGGFEGNAQTLREITDLLWCTGIEPRGMNPTRAFADGLLKYKRCAQKKVRSGDSKFLYHNQAPILREICGPLPKLLQEKIARHHTLRSAWKVKPSCRGLVEEIKTFQSLECQIMDWADETAYGLFDLMDGFRGGFITCEKIHTWNESQNWEQDHPARKALEHLAGILAGTSRGAPSSLSQYIARSIGTFIAATSLQERPASHRLRRTSNRYRYILHIDGEIVAVQKAFAKLAAELIFQTPQVKQLEWKASDMMRQLFDCLTENYLSDSPKRILSASHHETLRAIRDDKSRTVPRLVCDYIAGMTDSFFLRVYRRLFEPSFGSITDIA